MSFPLENARSYLEQMSRATTQEDLMTLVRLTLVEHQAQLESMATREHMANFEPRIDTEPRDLNQQRR